MKTTREVMAEEFAASGDEPETPGEPAAETPEPEAIPEPEHAAAEPDEPSEEKPDRPRGKDGKFAPKAAEQQKPLAAQPKKAAAVVPAPGVVPKPEHPAAPELKAPADWRPAAKEEFGKLPRVVQEEAIRLHTEVKKTLQDSAQARQTAEAFTRTLAPYEHMFRGIGKSPVEGVGLVMQQYAALHTAPMAHRAAIVAGLVRDFIGVDEASINLLASALEGKPGGAAPAAPQALRPEQIQQLVREEAQRMQTEGRRQAEVKAIQDFEASAPEFLANVTNELAAFVNIEQRQGKPITPELMKQAYEKAVRANPETAAILKQRDDAAAAKKKLVQAPAAAAAAAGIKSEPAGPTGNGTKRPKTTREQLAQDFAAAEGNHA